MPTWLDRRTLRFPEFAGDRLTVRMHHRDRQLLRAIAAEQGVSESEIAREAIAVLISVMTETDAQKTRT